jgi:hypothetical protein
LSDVNRDSRAGLAAHVPRERLRGRGPPARAPPRCPLRCTPPTGLRRRPPAPGGPCPPRRTARGRRCRTREGSSVARIGRHEALQEHLIASFADPLRHHHLHRALLAFPSARRLQTRLTTRLRDPQLGIAKRQLVELQLHVDLRGSPWTHPVSRDHTGKPRRITGHKVSFRCESVAPSNQPKPSGLLDHQLDLQGPVVCRPRR